MVNLVHLPNGQTITVSPVFGGLFFKANDLNIHHAVFPPGWTIVLQSEDNEDDHVLTTDNDEALPKKHHIHRYRTPTLRNDALFISSISNPSTSDFKPASSPSRQIAMMLWATLWCYRKADYGGKPYPNPHSTTEASLKLPEIARPKGEWRVRIKREGIFKGRHLLPKLERMGLISSEDSYVGNDACDRTGEGWTEMFVSQRSFWQLDARIFLFTLAPSLNTPSPFPSRPSSPNREGNGSPRADIHVELGPHGLWSPATPGPFTSSSHLPTYYPPPPPQYVMTNHVRHPIRPKPPRQGETFYTRYIPSFGQYLSFRVASQSPKSPKHNGPVGSTTPTFLPPHSAVSVGSQFSTLGSMSIQSCDLDLLHTWMNNPRVSAAWGASGPIETQERMLNTALNNKNSFPVIGCWDGKPFGYFEIYWVKEDQLGRYIQDVSDWDRGFHVLVGEEEFRGKERVKVWLSALVHYCWLADQRTQRVFLEPRVDNEKYEW
ncbi:MAG: hypothetical protein Q9187_008369 [Circinaria calcarea]